MNYQHLIDTATAIGCGVTLQAPMSAATTFKVGGPADLLIDLPDANAVSAVLKICHAEHIPYLFIGGMEMAFGYWISGIPFDLAHCAGNAALSFALLLPLSDLVKNIRSKQPQP